MAGWRLIAVGRMRAGPEAALFARYAARLSPPLGLLEIPEARGSAADIRRREAASVSAALAAREFVIALDCGGRMASSEDLARLLAAWRGLGRPLAFLIGGAEGLDGRLLARAEHTLSLGPPTWPHLLARVLLAEQIYRAASLLAGHPYHRARPDGPPGTGGAGL